MAAKSLAELSLDDVYILDSNLVIGYINDDIPGWRVWADKYLARGKKFLLLEMTMNEVSVMHPHLPPGFELLVMEDQIPQAFLDGVYEEVANAFNLVGKTRINMKTDIELLALAGYAAASSPQISDEDIFGDRVVFASNNFKCVKRVLYTEQKRKTFEKIIDDKGLEHLITVRLITREQTWIDFF